MYYTYFCRDNYAKLLVISFFVLFGFFSGCSKNDIGEPKKEIPEIVKEKEKPKNTFVIFTFSDSETKNFDKNIGAFCSTVSGGKKYFNLTQKNGKWGAEIDEKDLKGGKISLYYPVRENKNSNTASVKVMSDQSTESNFEKSSFYFGQVSLSEGKEVEASIKNIMYELEFDFQGDVPEDLSVELECSLEGEIKLSNGEIEVSKPEMQRLTPYKKGNGKYAIRIIPQSSNPQKKEKQSIKFVWENGKKSMDYIISDKIEGDFEKGGKKSLDVTLKSKEEQEVFVNFSISQEDKSFDDKSVIGVFSSVNKKNFTLTKEGDKWLPQVNRKDLEGSNVSVFYPVNSSLNSENYSLNIIADQSKKESFEKSKFYFAQKTFENETFDISPKNVMHEIEIRITGEVPNDLSIKVKSFPQGNLSLLNGEISVSKTNKGEITPYKTEDGKYALFILPQLTDSYKTDKEFITFTWNKGKDKMKYALPTTEGKSFEKGEKTILEVTLKSERKEEVSVPKDNKEKEGNKEKEMSTSTDKEKDKEGKSDNVSQGSGGNTSVAPKDEEKYVTFNLKKGKEDFEEGSVVGVFNARATSDAKKYFTITKKGGKWTPEINVKDLEGTSISFYYPVGEKATSNMYSFSAERSQGSQGRFEKSKFYFGQTTFGKGREEITSTLRNVMHELEINIEGKIPVNLVVRLEGNPSGKINLTNGDVTVSQGGSYSMIPYKLTDRKYSIVILPQSAALYKKEPGLVSFSWKGGKKYFTLKDAGDFLGKNKKTVLNVVLEEEKPKDSVKEKEDTPTNSGNTNNSPKKEDKNKDEKGTEGSNSATSGTTPSTGNSNANNGGSGVDNSSSNSGATSSDKDDHTSEGEENTNPKNDSETQGVGGNNPKEKETEEKDKGISNTDKDNDKDKGTTPPNTSKDDNGNKDKDNGTTDTSKDDNGNKDSDKDKENTDTTTTPSPKEEDMVIITFDTGAENPPAPMKVKKGATFIKLPEPTRSNREFMGWTDKEGDLTKYGAGMPLEVIHENIRLYANWRIINLSIGGASKNFKNQTVFLKGIPVPKDSEWQTVRGHDPKRKNIDWKKGHKWYDTDQFQNDLCWAATASNIIQWWLDQNADYIRRYGKYNQPHEHKNRFESDLFNFYKNKFEDRGNRPDLGVLWYIKGLSTKAGAGFFKDVFKDVELKRNTFFINKSEFNEMIDDALNNGKAISMVADGHATTMWGAHFDSDGYVDRIYYTDSADRSRDEKLGLRYIDVVYREEYGVLKPFMPSSVDGYYIQITSISTFSLGQDAWEEYFKNKE